MQGKLIVIEGTDGAGKSTQLELLTQYLKNQKQEVQTFHFPQYENTFFGQLIRRQLNGEFVGQSIPSEYLAVPYALDRWQLKSQLLTALSRGWVLVDRYVHSNAIYQGAKVSVEKRQAFMEWIYEMEYTILELPREAQVIFLHMPTAQAQELLSDKHHDVNEKDTLLLKTVEALFLQSAQTQPHWVKIDCVKNGLLRPKEAIHQEIVELL